MIWCTKCATHIYLTHMSSRTTIDIYTEYPPVISSIQSMVESKLGVQSKHVIIHV